ncbi:MAG TPA: FAD-binding oxidoreductase [Actinomycetota bacterium]|nr:FAD-binding oxidoreductase [Actinomycetota bacterium]
MSKGADVVVVGGGVIGCACAYELASHGAKVVLAERSELAAGASGRNHGLLLSPLDPGLAPMAESTLAAYAELTASTTVPVGMDAEPVGYLLVAMDDPAERKAASLEAEAAAACGVKIENLDRRAVRELEPELDESVAEGWLFDDGRRLQPAVLTAAFAQAAAAAGAVIRTHLAVRALSTQGDRVRGVLTDEGSLSADVVVVAAGPWTPTLVRPLGVNMPITGARGWLVNVAPAQAPVRRLVSRAGWHAPPDPDGTPPVRAADLVGGSPPGEMIGTMLQPNTDGTMLIGGSRQFAFTPEPDDPSVPQRLLAGAIDLVPSLAGAPVQGAWWGIRPMTPDGRPVIDEVGAGVVVASGHGSLGVILGGGTARLVASIVLETEAPFDAEPFAAARFG